MQSGVEDKEGHQVVVLESAIHGRGLFAGEHIPDDSWIGTLVGSTTREDGEHVLWISEDDGRTWGLEGENELRYVNHSSDPNAVFYGADLFSLRFIEEGEEITFDYGPEWA